mgnify:CR=1 FL=1
MKELKALALMTFIIARTWSVESGEGIESSGTPGQSWRPFSFVESGEGIESSSVCNRAIGPIRFVESGEGIESCPAGELQSFRDQISWNPVKELKVDSPNRAVGVVRQTWNPVKELKDVSPRSASKTTR